MRGVERAADLADQVDGAGGVERAAAAQQRVEVLPLDQAHVEEQLAVDLAVAVDRDDVRLVEPGGDLRLAPEPAAVALVLRPLRVQHLERDLAGVLGVVRAQDAAHAAVAEHPEHAVRPEVLAVRRGGHYRSRGQRRQLPPQVGGRLGAAVEHLQQHPLVRRVDAVGGQPGAEEDQRRAEHVDQVGLGPAAALAQVQHVGRVAVPGLARSRVSRAAMAGRVEVARAGRDAAGRGLHLGRDPRREVLASTHARTCGPMSSGRWSATSRKLTLACASAGTIVLWPGPV